MSTESAESKVYEGGCHCKANRYEVEISPPLDQKHNVISCNCSICHINGYYLAFTDQEKIKWVSGGPEKLTSYLFNKKQLTHLFCPVCGSSLIVFGELGGVHKTGVNVRSMDDVSLDGLQVYKYDGKSK